MSKQELGIFIHPLATKEAKTKAISINERYPSSFLTQETADLKGASHVLVAAGDGSVRRVLQYLYRNDSLIPIGLLGGGTNNILLRNLVEQNLQQTLEDFLAGSPNQKFLIHPGMFEDEKGNKEIYSVTVGVGNYEKFTGHVLEKIRPHTRPEERRRLTPFLSLFPLLMAQNRALPTLDLVSISPHFGNVVLFPKQDIMNASLLTHATIKEQGIEGFKRLILTVLAWKTGRKPSKNHIQIEHGEGFELVNPDNTIWTDGDTSFRRNHGRIFVSRTPNAIALSAVA